MAKYVINKKMSKIQKKMAIIDAIDYCTGENMRYEIIAKDVSIVYNAEKNCITMYDSSNEVCEEVVTFMCKNVYISQMADFILSYIG